MQLTGQCPLGQGQGCEIWDMDPWAQARHGSRLPEIHCGGLTGRWDRAGLWVRFGVAFEMEHQKLNRAPACVSHNIITCMATAQHSVLHRLPCSHRVTRASLLTIPFPMRRPPREEAAGQDWAATRTTMSCCGTDERSPEARCLYYWPYNQSFIHSERGPPAQPLALPSHPLPLVLGDGLILARVPFSACLGVELLNFLDQDVLALSSSPNCAQPPSPQKRDRVKIARLCLQLSAASFPREQIRTHQSPVATAPSGVTLQVITRTHRSFESNILLC